MSGLPYDDRHVPYFDFDHVLRSFATRLPKIDLQGEHVAPRARIERPSCEVLLIREVHLFNCSGGKSG